MESGEADQEQEQLEIPEDSEIIDVRVSETPTEENYDNENEGVTILQLGGSVRGKYYKQTYRSAWEQMPDFKGWLRGVHGEPTRAYCTYCQKTLHAHRLSLLKHTCTIRHQKAAQMHNSRKTNKSHEEVHEYTWSSGSDAGEHLNDSDPSYSPTNCIEIITTDKPSRVKKSNTHYKYSQSRCKKSTGTSFVKKEKKSLSSENAANEINDAINQLQSLSDSINVKEDDQFDLFGKYISSQLREMDIVKALRAQQRIYQFVSDLRLAEINENANKNNKEVTNDGSSQVAFITVPATSTSEAKSE